MVVTPNMLGLPIKRGEDPRLVSGSGAYLEDLALGGVVHLVFGRSPHAHARIKNIDVSTPRGMPGVLAVLTAAEVDAVLPVDLPKDWPAFEVDNPPPNKILARDKVRFVGEPFVGVVATSRAEAQDAIDAIEIDYEPLPAVADPEAALEPGAPLLYEELGTNLAHRMVKSGGDVEEAFKRPDVRIVTGRFENPRVLPVPMETRGAAATFDAGTGELTFWASTQFPHSFRSMLAGILDLPETNVRVIAPDVGGGFGAKIDFTAEDVLTGLLAMRLRRPVRWVEERRENFLNMVHGRGQIDYVEAAVKSDGEIVGLKVRAIADLGGRYNLNTPGIAPLTPVVLPGPYRTPNIEFTLDGVYTSKTPVGAYRGAGRPEATYLVERIVDVVADELKLDPADVRRKNFLRAEEFPYTTPMGTSYDTGDYAPALDRVLDMAGYADLRRKQIAWRNDPSKPLIGIGISGYLEICAFGPWESATVRVEKSGKVTLLAGTSPHGQGHVTPFRQIVADQLGVPLDDIRVLFNDTARVPTGVGTFGSRSAAVGGSAVLGASERVRDKVIRLAADALEAAPEDVQIEQGRISVRGVPDRSTTLGALAARAYNGEVPEGDEPGLEANRFFKPEAETFPFGMHLAVVEVDRETGKVRLVRYLAVDDCGRVLNPMMVDGQRHGGIAQGVGQALFEEVLYDDTGQPTTSTLGDYALPRAADFPEFELDRTVTPTPRNPLGAKGIGEAGTIGSTPALVNAVVDALSHLGITHLDMPTTPEKVWRVLQSNGAT
ncbi:MAG: xanthine dehydrogenase family protein molybdopterin-binding subunit [Chloroflexi bacterium]|nr:xanthine dehydrogenase family protein molybdopterin-binding subunit [Chloroflexota bacterium]MBV9603186.1 xanthine dehydrogenase family protein molybdopterin-binding subunit [Chloroflexota bacterium]